MRDRNKSVTPQWLLHVISTLEQSYSSLKKKKEENNWSKAYKDVRYVR